MNRHIESVLARLNARQSSRLIRFSKEDLKIIRRVIRDVYFDGYDTKKDDMTDYKSKAR